MYIHIIIKCATEYILQQQSYAHNLLFSIIYALHDACCVQCHCIFNVFNADRKKKNMEKNKNIIAFMRNECMNN